MRDELAAVADAKDGDAAREDGGVCEGCAGLVNAVGAAGEDKADGLHRKQLLKRGVVRFDLAVDIALAHAARDELVVLAAEVKDDYGLSVWHFRFNLLSLKSGL